MSAAMDSGILLRLARVIEQRLGDDPGSSYVASLQQKGLDRMLRKVAEESTEFLFAARDGDRREVVYEAADLWFHTLVVLAHLDLGPEDVLEELERRFGLSGIEEKAARKS